MENQPTQHHYVQEDTLDFGKSKFRGRDSLIADLERAGAQLTVLLKKNWYQIQLLAPPWPVDLISSLPEGL